MARSSLVVGCFLTGADEYQQLYIKSKPPSPLSYSVERVQRELESVSMQIQTRAMYDYSNNQMMMSSPSSPTPAYIQHPISKLDTLPGIAIKYGVEVADIKKTNGLVTDRQMFALKTLDIPLHGKHPPPTGYDNPEHSPPDNAHFELFESFHSLKRKSSEQKLSPVMRSLQGHKPALKKSISEIFNLVDYEKMASKASENGSFYRKSPMSRQPFSRHQKSLSLAVGTLNEIVESSDIMEVVETRKSDSDKRNGTLIRRNNKSEANLRRIPELLLKQDNSCNGGFSPRSAIGLAQRQKSSSRMPLSAYSKRVV